MLSGEKLEENIQHSIVRITACHLPPDLSLPAHSWSALFTNDRKRWERVGLDQMASRPITDADDWCSLARPIYRLSDGELTMFATSRFPLVAPRWFVSVAGSATGDGVRYEDLLSSPLTL